VTGRRPQWTASAAGNVLTLSDLTTGISNLLQPAQAEVVLGQLSTYLASWGATSQEKSDRLAKQSKKNVLNFLFYHVFESVPMFNHSWVLFQG
jgi:hypothetical protein